MKLMKKVLLVGICILAMGSVTACGNNNATDGTGTGNETNVNDATGGNSDDQNGDNLIDDAADATRDVTDGVANGVNDILDNNDNNTNNDVNQNQTTNNAK